MGGFRAEQEVRIQQHRGVETSGRIDPERNAGGLVTTDEGVHPERGGHVGCGGRPNDDSMIRVHRQFSLDAVRRRNYRCAARLSTSLRTRARMAFRPAS